MLGADCNKSLYYIFHQLRNVIIGKIEMLLIIYFKTISSQNKPQDNILHLEIEFGNKKIQS